MQSQREMESKQITRGREEVMIREERSWVRKGCQEKIQSKLITIDIGAKWSGEKSRTKE